MFWEDPLTPEIRADALIVLIIFTECMQRIGFLLKIKLVLGKEYQERLLNQNWICLLKPEPVMAWCHCWKSCVPPTSCSLFWCLLNSVLRWLDTLTLQNTKKKPEKQLLVLRMIVEFSRLTKSEDERWWKEGSGKTKTAGKGAGGSGGKGSICLPFGTSF